jgi:hypothetical protein
MNEVEQKNSDFLVIYTKSYRLAAAVFMISNMIDQGESLRTKIKDLALVLVSISVNLKDINFLDARKLITDIEKKSLELMSMLDIACVSNLISKMNVSILKEEFQSFILELGKFTESFENNKSVSVKGLFSESPILSINNNLKKTDLVDNFASNICKDEQKKYVKNGIKNGSGHKRKDLRKNTILDFVKGHNDVSIKDIAANITGCSEKTIQRELTSLIGEGRIRKIGERRWSKYSII